MKDDARAVSLPSISNFRDFIYGAISLEEYRESKSSPVVQYLHSEKSDLENVDEEERGSCRILEKED